MRRFLRVRRSLHIAGLWQAPNQLMALNYSYLERKKTLEGQDKHFATFFKALYFGGICLIFFLGIRA